MSARFAESSLCKRGSMARYAVRPSREMCFQMGEVQIEARRAGVVLSGVRFRSRLVVPGWYRVGMVGACG